MPKSATLLAALALIVIALSTVHAAPGAPAVINVVDFAFEDATTGLAASVSVGAPVWTFVTGIHTVTALDGAFDSGILGPGDTFAPTLEPGAYAYTCALHATMRGVVVVA